MEIPVVTHIIPEDKLFGFRADIVGTELCLSPKNNVYINGIKLDKHITRVSFVGGSEDKSRVMITGLLYKLDKETKDSWGIPHDAYKEPVEADLIRYLEDKYKRKRLSNWLGDTSN